MTEQQQRQTIIGWIEQDPMRMLALRTAQELGLNDWCLAAGFVRNLVWDRLHELTQTTPLNDIDVIYFDSQVICVETEKRLEQRLSKTAALPWSVKNQARMHILHDHRPYSSSSEAMSYWVETETVIGATLSSNGEVILVAPLGTAELFEFSITANPRHGNPQVMLERAESKGWLTRWPRLRLKM
ncbi:nitrate reductase [Enterobacterales bacterium]|nr:nitrate reductase [Enterobacterales bacterium]